MRLEKDYHIEIQNAFKSIFDLNESKVEISGLRVTINEPLVKQQIILVAKICQDVPLNTILKSTGGKTIIEFW